MLTISTLGSFHITIEDKPLTALRGKKAQALLVFLALQAGKRFERKQLQGLLWSDSDAKKSAASLRQTLTALRRSLPDDLLHLEQSTVMLDASAEFWLDAHHIEQDPTLYNGQFLASFDLKNADVWESWLFAQREQLEVATITTLEKRASLAMMDRQYDVAVQRLQRILAIDGWRESTHRSLMEAFWLAGERGAALAQFEQCKQTLWDELGVEPSVETTELAKRISSDSPKTNSTLPPLDSVPLFGRKETLDHITRLFQDPTCRLITLYGLGGIGKTRLALAYAHEQAQRFADGVWFIDLSGEDANTLATSLAVGLQIGLRGRDEPRQRVLNELRNKNALLILDNFETVLDSAEARTLVTAMLQNAPDVTLLITSRERLNLQSEWSIGVEGLDNQAIDLFVYHARRVSPSFQADDVATIEKICALVEGMPLAISLAAAWVRLLSLRDVLRELEHGISLITTTGHDIPVRQRSLEVILNYAFERLAPNLQRVLGRLALMRGTFDRKAASTIADASLFDLMALQDRSLLYRVGRDRYRLHMRLRQFAAAKLGANYNDSASRHAKYFLNTLANSLPALFNHQQSNTLETIEHDRENILAAWEHGLETKQWALIASAEKSLFYFFRISERWIEAETLFSTAVHSAAPRQLATRLKLRLAATLIERAILSEVMPLLDACSVAADSDDPTIVGFYHHLRGSAAQVYGDFQQASNAYIAAITAFTSADATFEMVYTLSYLGYLGYQAQSYDDAKVAYEQALTIYQAVNDIDSIALTRHNLAYVEEKLGNLTAATELVEQSFEAMQTPDRYFRSIESLNAFVSESRLPLPSTFEQDVRQWLREAMAAGNQYDEMSAAGRLASFSLRNEEWEKAQRYLDQSIAVAHDLNLQWVVDLGVIINDYISQFTSET